VTSGGWSAVGFMRDHLSLDDDAIVFDVQFTRCDEPASGR